MRQPDPIITRGTYGGNRIPKSHLERFSLGALTRDGVPVAVADFLKEL